MTFPIHEQITRGNPWLWNVQPIIFPLGFWKSETILESGYDKLVKQIATWKQQFR